MPGLFGAVAVNDPAAVDPDDAKATLASMSTALVHTGQLSELWSDSSMGIYVGRVGPERFNTVSWCGKSPTAGRGTYSFVAGSLTNHPPAGSEDQSGIAVAFAESGRRVLGRLHGPFAVMVHSDEPRETLIAADRCAHLPIYYAQVDGVLYFAPEIKALLCVPALPTELDAASVATYMASGHSLSGRSLLSAVRSIRAGQALSVRNGSVDAFQYWRFMPGSAVDGASEADLETELGELIANSTRKNFGDPSDTVIFLSGGADSRAVLAGALDAVDGHADQLRAVTWAAERKSENSDAGVAARLAEKLGLQHRFAERKTGDYAFHFQRSNRLIDGKSDMAALHPYEHQFMLDLRDAGFNRAFRGDQVFGQGGMRHVPAMTKEQALAEAVLRRLRRLDLASTYIRPEVFGRLADACDAVLDAELEELREFEVREAREILYHMHRLPMYLNSSSYLKQVVLDPRNVLLDDEILDFLARVPGALREGKQIMHRAMRRRHPDLWSVPFATETNLEDWDWQFGHDTEVRRYALEQLEDTSSAIWEYFDPQALQGIVSSLAGHRTGRNPVTQRPIVTAVKKAMLAIAPQFTAHLVVGREARFHPKSRILARVLAFKHWYDSTSSDR